MRNSIIYKMINTIKNCFFTLSFLLLFSCSNDFDISKDTKLNDNTVISFKVVLDNTERTVFSDGVSSVNSLTNFIVEKYHRYHSNNYEIIGTYNSYDELMHAQIEVPQSAIQKDSWCTFRITASYGESVYQGSTELDLRENDTVSIVLKLSSLGNGYGSLDFTLDFSQISNFGLIDSAKVSVTNINSGLYDELLYGTGTAQNLISNGTVNYADTEIPAGYYRILVELYYNEGRVGVWQEIVQIATDLSSTAIRQINKLNIPQQIYFNLSDGGDPNTNFEYSDVPLEFIGSISTLPSPNRDGYLFLGWYFDAKHEYPISLPLTSGADLYAKWQVLGNNDIVITADNYQQVFDAFDNEDVSSINIYVIGDISQKLIDTEYGSEVIDPIHRINASIPSLINRLKNLTSINLDLSNSTGLEELVNCPFSKYDVNAVSIVLPDSVISIYDSSFPANLTYIYLGKELSAISKDAFRGCTHINQVELSEFNENFYLNTGVLYYKTSLILYPGNIESTSYTIPDNIVDIYSYAFSSNSSITELVLGANIQEFGRMSLCGPSLTNISVTDENAYIYLDTDNCLYRNDGSLIRYLGNENSVDIDASNVSVIYPGAFYNTTLTSVELLGSTGTWRYSSRYTSEQNYDSHFDYCIALDNMGEIELNNSNEIVNLSDYEDFYLYSLEIAYISDVIAFSIPVDTYDNVTYTVNNDSYSIYPVKDGSYLFKFPIAQNKIYRIYYVTLDNASPATGSNFELPPDFEPGYEVFRIFDYNLNDLYGNYINDYIEPSWYPNAAENPENNYLYLEAYKPNWAEASGSFAFRIVELDAD